jgi:hypothetical protein
MIIVVCLIIDSYLKPFDAVHGILDVKATCYQP